MSTSAMFAIENSSDYYVIRGVKTTDHSGQTVIVVTETVPHSPSFDSPFVLLQQRELVCELDVNGDEKLFVFRGDNSEKPDMAKASRIHHWDGDDSVFDHHPAGFKIADKPWWYHPIQNLNGPEDIITGPHPSRYNLTLDRPGDRYMAVWDLEIHVVPSDCVNPGSAYIGRMHVRSGRAYIAGKLLTASWVCRTSRDGIYGGSLFTTFSVGSRTPYIQMDVDYYPSGGNVRATTFIIKALDVWRFD